VLAGVGAAGLIAVVVWGVWRVRRSRPPGRSPATPSANGWTGSRPELGVSGVRRLVLCEGETVAHEPEGSLTQTGAQERGGARRISLAATEQFFDIPIADAEPKVEPHGMADDLNRKAVMFVAVGRSRGVHAARCHIRQRLWDSRTKLTAPI
jgi:hypothetical protein